MEDPLLNRHNIRLLNWHIFFFSLTDRNFWSLILAFLLAHGLPVWEFFLFCLIWNVGYTVLLVPCINLSIKYGFKFNAIIGLCCYGLHVLSYPFLPFFGIWNIVISALLASLFISFYWPARHILYSSSIPPHETGKGVAVMNIVEILSEAVAVILFAFLYKFLGEGTSHLFVFGFLAISLIPFWFVRIPSAKKEMDLSWKSFFAHQKQENIRPFRIAYMSEGLGMFLSDLLIILVIFYKMDGLESYGIITLMSSIILALLVYFVGHHFDRGKKKEIAKNSTIAVQITTLLQAVIPFFLVNWYIVLINSLSRFSRKACGGLLNSVWYRESHFSGAPVNVLLREFYLNVGRIIASVVALFVLYYTDLKYDYFLIAVTILPLHFLQRFRYLGDREEKITLFPRDPERVTTP